IGLAETHQTLVRNHLRGRIAVQVDGGLRTGRDIVIGALLGADEFGFGTGALIAAGCVMMRKCHLNTCPVGVATQDPELRKRFPGQPAHVINFFTFLVQEVRELMAQLGFRTFDQMIGRSDRLDMRRAIHHWKARGLDFTRLLAVPLAPPGVATYHCEEQDHGLSGALDHRLIAQARPALEARQPVWIETPVRNSDRTVGAMLSGQVARRYGHAGLPDDTIHVRLTGSAGQSFGAFLARGVTLELDGEANDYVGKGLSGGRIIVRPSAASNRRAEEHIIIGNTVLYGAIAGECYARGVAGERFAVRNSGALAVVEGTGDHGCEYMTGGVVVVLGATGRNFAAGMSGGIAYVLDEAGDFARRANKAMVALEPLNDVEETLKNLASDEWNRLAQAELPADPLRHDARRLHILVARHYLYTGSEPARRVLEHWRELLPKFVKIMPLDYRRALQDLQAQARAAARQDAEKTGLDVGA
ncbi:MAG TPA: glutamate synthase-related protein, partial [Candidatus Contendobacter sp.]|nr:glutamate synthase-related protein [Candidatus Contendobacter sp.]